MKIEPVHYYPGGVPVRIGWRMRWTARSRWHFLLSEAHTARVIEREKAKRR